MENKNLGNLNLKKLKILIDIVKYESIQLTTKHTGIPKKKIHQTIQEIEEKIGENIFYRKGELISSEKVILTPVGIEIFNTSKKINNILLEDNINSKKNPISQNLTIACPLIFSHYFLPYAIKKYREKYPESIITISQYKQNHMPNISEYDIIIGPDSPPADDLSQYLIKTFTYGYYASSDYLKEYGIPKTLDDLKKHKILENMNIESKCSDTRIIIKSDSPFNLNEFTLKNFGICSLSNDEIKNNKRYFKLKRVLPKITTEKIDMKFKFLKTSVKKKYILELLHFCEHKIEELWKL